MYNSFDNPGLVRVLSFLKSHNTEYLSGQDLSDVLKISRVAVWKHIKKIKELGYKIESKQKLGYRLSETTNRLLPWEITANLTTKLIGKKIYYFESIDSTQTYAIKIAENKKENGSVIIAEKQTGGKGRLGRKWISPKGGIWISIILHPEFSITATMLFPVAASLALSLAIEKCTKIKPNLKWPNDVVINGKKIAGTLVDMSLESNKVESIVLGVGINFDVNILQIEKTLRKLPNFYGASSIKKHDKNAQSLILIQTFLQELEKIYEKLRMSKYNEITREWTRRSSTIGQEIEILDGTEKIKGKAIRIDQDGALVIEDKSKSRRIMVGDVSR